MTEHVRIDVEYGDDLRTKRDRSDEQVLKQDCWYLVGAEAVTPEARTHTANEIAKVRAKDAGRRRYWTSQAIERAVSIVLNQVPAEDDLDGVTVTVTVADLVVTAALAPKVS